MPAADVKPYVKRHKSDAADAEAISEAVTAPACSSLRPRHLSRRTAPTAVINAIRAHLAEFGIVAPVGRNSVEDLLRLVADAKDKRVPKTASAWLAALGVQQRMLMARSDPERTVSVAVG